MITVDHTGGIGRPLRAYPKLTIRSSFDNPQHLPCLQGGSMAMERPFQRALAADIISRLPKKNNDSCVISLTDGNSVIFINR